MTGEYHSNSYSLADRQQDIKKMFMELHGASIKSNLLDAAINLMVSNSRTSSKGEDFEKLCDDFQRLTRDNPEAWDYYQKIKADKNPLADGFLHVLTTILKTDKVRYSLSSVDPRQPMATPATVGKIGFTSFASPSTPLTTPAGNTSYGSSVKNLPGPTRLFSSPAGTPAATPSRFHSTSTAPRRTEAAHHTGPVFAPGGGASLSGSADGVETPVKGGVIAAPSKTPKPDAKAASRAKDRDSPPATGKSARGGERAGAKTSADKKPGPPSERRGGEAGRSRLSKGELKVVPEAHKGGSMEDENSKSLGEEDNGESDRPSGNSTIGDGFYGDDNGMPLTLEMTPEALAGGHHVNTLNNPTFDSLTETSPIRLTAQYMPTLADTLRQRQHDKQRLAPAVPDVGDLFVLVQTQEGPPLCSTLPDWWYTREYQTTDFFLQLAMERQEHGEDGAMDHEEKLEMLPPSVQEYIVINELLYAFMGFSGRYIYAERRDAGNPSIVFKMDGNLPVSLMELTYRLLPLCDYVIVVQRFIEMRSGYNWGLVSHAVSAAMRSMVDDWELMVVQLEHQLRLGKLTMQALWYHCQQPLTTLKLMAWIAAEAAARKLRGVDLLNLLYRKESEKSGDVQARRLIGRLLQAGCQPYFEMLERWLCEGIVDDPYGEFMVKEDPDVTKASLSDSETSAYWYHRYSVRVSVDPEAPDQVRRDAEGNVVHDVPVFLESCKHTILTTGKYLNAMRECGKVAVSTLQPDEHITYDPNERHIQQINRAFQGASIALLNVMYNDLGLLSKLRSLKSYFLCDRGDMLIAFMDVADEELNKKAHEVSLVRLQSMLDLAVRSSSAASDPHSQDLKCLLDYRSLLGMLKHILRLPETSPTRTKQGGGPTIKLTAWSAPMAALSSALPSTPATAAAGTSTFVAEQKLLQARTGREAFLLTYKVDWPLSVVISEQFLMQYQLVFRHLFELKYVERELNAIWRIYQTTRQLYSTPSDVLRRCYGLCQQMGHFFKEYLLYLTFEVLEPAWHSLELQLKSANNIDEVVQYHKDLLQRIMKGCLLSRRVKLLRTLVELKALALKFAEVTNRIKVDTSMFQIGEHESEYLSVHDYQLRRLKTETMNASIRNAVENSLFDRAIRDLQLTFNTKFKDFILQIGDIYKAAQKNSEESREELESLLNLINRLDFNHYFQNKVDYSIIMERGGMP